MYLTALNQVRMVLNDIKLCICPWHISTMRSNQHSKTKNGTKIKHDKTGSSFRRESDVGCHPMEVWVHVFGHTIPIARRDHIESTSFRPRIDFVANCNDHHDQIKPVQHIPCIQEVVPPKGKAGVLYRYSKVISQFHITKNAILIHSQLWAWWSPKSCRFWTRSPRIQPLPP